MELTHSITTEVPTEVEYFPHFSVESVAKGTRIKAQSPLFAELFDAIGGKSNVASDHRAWTGIVFAIPRNIRSVTADYNTGHGLFLGDSGSPNLLWLFGGDLKEGIDIMVAEPLSLNNLEDWFTQSCEQLRAIYLNSIRKVKFTASLREKKKKLPNLEGLRRALETQATTNPMGAFFTAADGPPR